VVDVRRTVIVWFLEYNSSENFDLADLAISLLVSARISCSTALSGASHVFIMFCSDSSQLIAATTLAGGVFVLATIQMTIQDFEYGVATPRSQFSTYSVKPLTPFAVTLFIMSSYTNLPFNEEANEKQVTLHSSRDVLLGSPHLAQPDTFHHQQRSGI
jgi:hypothetical protein